MNAHSRLQGENFGCNQCMRPAIRAGQRKKWFWLFTSVLLAGFCTQAQSQDLGQNASGQVVAMAGPVEILPYDAADRGLNHLVWKRVTAMTNQHGQVHYHTNSFTQLSTGMHHLVGGQLVESTEEIEVTPQGAQATNAQHQVVLSGELNAAHAIDLTTPDNKHLRSHVLGMNYFDTSSGASVLIAEVKDSHGVLLPTKNQVLYPDAFTDFRADVRYTFTRSGFEQDIILREQPPSLAQWGLNPDTTWLQVMTEFEDPPTPNSTQSSEGEDEILDFGAMMIGRGKAFIMGDESQVTPVRKHWFTSGGRTFLLEEIQLAQVQSQLQTLPPAAEPTSNRQSSPNKLLNRLSPNRLLPQPKLARASTGVLRPSSFPSIEKGLVLDYNIVITTSNFTFQSDTTYYVTNSVNLTGTTTIEGGTVIKFATNPAAQITITGTNVICQTTNYRPAVFTGRDDNTAGEILPGSTGTPTNYYGSGIVLLDVSLKNTRFTRMGTALTLASSGAHSLNLTDAQFVNCQNAFGVNTGNTINLENSLFSCTSNLFNATGAFTNNGQHLTVDQCTAFVSAGNSGLTLNLTNSLLVGVTNWNGCGYTTNSSVVLLPSGSGIFQTVGAASYYLAANSPYRNAGVTTISADLLADLQQKTTYPPVVFAGAGVVTNMVNLDLIPQAQRDTDIPDLGYHYDPLDYVIGGLAFNNMVVTVYPGTAIGVYSPQNGSGTAVGCLLYDGGQFACQGSPTNRNWIVRYNTVQEQSTTNWSGGYGGFGGCLGTLFYSSPPLVQCRFTDFSVLAQDADEFHAYNYFATTNPPVFQNCQFHGGTVQSDDDTIMLTNCLFERVNMTLQFIDTNTPCIRNNLFWRGTLSFDEQTVTNAMIKDNLFDQTSIPDYSYDYGTYNGGHNAYVTNGDMLQPTNATDLILAASPAYQTSWLGHYYLPTNSVLINADTNTTADQVGLYHYTTTTNQVKETNSFLDIGYHYVAVDAYGNPIDTNGDGVPDYREDANGNGLDDAGETPWNLAILTQPVSQTATAGDNVSFSVTAAGLPTLRYQWLLNGTNIAAATNATLSLNSVTNANAGTYSVMVTNSAVSILSSNAILTILAPAVTITAPENNWLYAAPATILMQAMVTNGGGEVADVIFYTNGTPLYTNTGPNYQYNWTNVSAGAYALKAVAQLTNGFMATSAVVNISVAGPCSTNFNAGNAFGSGYLMNLNYTNGASQLQIDAKTTPMPFLNIPFFDDGSLLRIDTTSSNGAVVGYYRAGPQGKPSNPGHAAVDRYGNVWVANWGEAGTEDGTTNGSVTRIGVVIGGTRGNLSTNAGVVTFTPTNTGAFLKPPFQYSTAVDRDGDGYIRTSYGLNNVLNWPSNSPAGSVQDAQDECIINYTRVPGQYISGVAPDTNNDVWAGGFCFYYSLGNKIQAKIDGKTGVVVSGSQHTFSTNGVIYGGFENLVGTNGMLWSSGGANYVSGCRSLVSYNPATGTTNINTNSAANFGMAIDPQTGNVWIAGYDSGYVYVYTPSGSLLTNYTHGDTYASGLAIDNSGNVWVSHGPWFGAANVGHLRTDGTFLGNVPLTPTDGSPSQPASAVAIDAAGKIWAICTTSSNIFRIDPNLGATNYGYRIGAVDLFEPLQYSGYRSANGDLTGQQLLSGGIPAGFWDVVDDSSLPGNAWGMLSWNASTNDTNQVKVEVRAADMQTWLTSTNFQVVTNGGLITNLIGRYLEIRVTLLQVPGATNSPGLHDLTVSCIPPWQPTVTITSPTNRAAFLDTAAIPITAATTDTGGASIVNVGFYNNGNSIGQSIVSSNGVFSLLWTNAPPGTNVLTAVAWDEFGASATSQVVTTIVHRAAHILYPTNGQIFTNCLPWSGLSLTGAVADGLGLTTGLAYGWTNLSQLITNPGPVTIASPTSSNTTATIIAPGVYQFQFTASDGTFTNSATATITVLPDILTATPLTSLVRPVGSNATFSTTPSGNGPFNYGWYFQVTNSLHSNTSYFTITNIALTNYGTYSVVVTDACQQVVTNSALLSYDGECFGGECMPTGLVAWWQAQGNANDSVGTNNGTPDRDVTFEPGRVGQAFTFHGGEELVRIPDGTNLNVTNVTLEGWIKMGQIIGGDPHALTNQPYFVLPLISKDYVSDLANIPSVQQYSLGIQNVGNGAYFETDIGLAAGYGMLRGVTSITPLIWYHVAMTYNGTNLALYVNGNLETNFPFSAALTTTTNSLLIGAGNSGWADYDNAPLQIDEVRLYGRALSALEVSNDYYADANSMTIECASPTNSFGDSPLTFLGASVSTNVVEPGQTVTGVLNFYGNPRSTTNLWGGMSSRTVLENDGLCFFEIGGIPEVETLSSFWQGTTTLRFPITATSDSLPGIYDLKLFLYGAVTNDYNPGYNSVCAITVTNGVSASISSPAQLAVISPGSNVVVSASGLNSNPGFPITNLLFFVNGNYFTALAGSAGTVNWLPPSNGNYTIAVVATDVLGNRGSQHIEVGVDQTNWAAITSPSDQETFSVPGNLALAASTNPSVGITSLGFYANGVFLGQGALSSGSYSYTWTNPISGNYSLTTVATNAVGLTQTSSPVHILLNYITVKQYTPAVLSGYPGQTITFAGNWIGGPVNGSVSKDFLQTQPFLNGTNLPSPWNYGTFAPGTTPPPFWSNYNTFTGSLQIPTNAATGTNQLNNSAGNGVASLPMMPGPGVIPVTIVRNGQSVLSYQTAQLVVLANGNGTSSVPYVTITNLTNYQNIYPSTNVTIKVSAGETNSLLAGVAYYANGMLLGSNSVAPYSFSWTNAVQGRYSLRAVAYDTNGVATTSEAITINDFQYPLTVYPATPTLIVAEPGQQTTVVHNFAGGPTTDSLAPEDAVVNATGQVAFGGDPFTNPTNTMDWTNGGTFTNTVTLPPALQAGTYGLHLAMTNGTGNAFPMNTGPGVVAGTNVIEPDYLIGGLIVNDGVTVAITQPANNSIVPANSPLNITGLVTARYALISNIVFYANGINIGQTNQGVGTISWTPTDEGSYTLSVVASDILGSRSTNQIIIQAYNSLGLSLTTPTNNQTFVPNTGIPLSAWTPNYYVSWVNYYANGTLLAQAVNGNPYTFTWNSSNFCGSIPIWAVAYGESGVVATSAVANISFQTTVTPTYANIDQGTNATFSVTALTNSGTTYQWQLNGANVAGATSTSISASNAGVYTVTASITGCGTIGSSSGLLTVNGGPLITSQPTNQDVAAGGTATFQVTAQGKGPLHYFWYYASTYGIWYGSTGSVVSVGTSSALVITNVQHVNAGIYSVVVSNDYGTVLSGRTRLTIAHYLGLGVTNSGDGSSTNSVFNWSDPGTYDSWVYNQGSYSSFHYLSNGVYGTYGNGGSSPTRVLEGCKHFGRNSSLIQTNTIVQLVPAGPTYATDVFSSPQPGPGFELHDLTVDANGINQLGWDSPPHFVCAIALQGSDQLYENVWVHGFGAAPGCMIEVFPVDLGTGSFNNPQPQEVENIRIADSTIGPPAVPPDPNGGGVNGPDAGASWPGYTTNSASIVITNCVIEGVTHAVLFPTIVNCLFTNCGIAFYQEPGGDGPGDPDTNLLGSVVFNGNQVINCGQGVNINPHPGNWNMGPITMVSNLFILNTNNPKALAFQVSNISPGSSMLISQMTAAYNTVRFPDGLPVPTAPNLGFDFSCIGTLVASNNILSLGNGLDFIIENHLVQNKTITNNVDYLGNPIFISDGFGNLYPQQAPPP